MSDIRREPPRWTAGGGDSSLGDLLRRVPEPQAPLGARQRVWRELVSEPMRRSRLPWIFAIAGSAAAAAALFTFVLVPRAQPLAVIQSAGPVEVATADGPWNAPRPAEPLADGAQIRTRAGGHARVRFEDVGVVLGPETAAAVHQRGAALEIGLSQGYVVVADAPRPEARPFTVTKGDYTVRVLGTIFSVNASTAELEVRVQEGLVEVTGPSTQVRLGPGQSWTSGRGVEARALPPRQAEVASQLLRGEGPGEAQLEAGALEPPTAEAKVEPSPAVAPQAAVDSPQPSAPARTPSVAAHASKAHAPVLRGTAASGGAFDDVTMLRAKLVGATSAPEREQLSYELGKALAARGSYAEAVDAYATAANGTGAHAELALYEVGKLQLRRLGDPSSAVTAFRRAQQRFPRGQLGPELQLSLIEALLDQHQYTEAAPAMDAFLASYPDNERRTEVLSLRGNLRREQGDCRGALADYSALEGGPSADDALYYSAFCKQKLKDADGARRLLERYRSLFPAGGHIGDVERALAAP